jgi:hypothetical protein
MKLAIILTVLVLATVEARASCATMQKLAQEHSNDMARRGSMDHAGFMDRARRGARAENVAEGVKTRTRRSLCGGHRLATRPTCVCRDAKPWRTRSGAAFIIGRW